MGDTNTNDSIDDPMQGIALFIQCYLQTTDETDTNHSINYNIREIALFLQSYLHTTNGGPLNPKKVDQISRLIGITATQGTREQQWQLYLILLGTRAHLAEMGLTNLERPITKLTRFFKSKSPVETKNVENALLLADSIGKGAAAGQ